MTLLETWVATPLAGAMGWALLHSLWEGAIVAAALAATLRAMRSPRARYAAACAALVVMLAGFGATLARAIPEGTNGLTAGRAHVLPAWKVPTGGEAADPIKAGLAAMVPWLAPFWLAGVWGFYLRHAAGWISVGRLRRRGVCCAPARWQVELDRLRRRLLVSRPVVLLESSLADAPMVLGHFRPVILMPLGLLAGLPAGQMEAILLHELAHIRRYDYLVNVWQRLAEGLLFYHPAVWWMSRVIRAERENCCDDLVVAMTGDAHEYAVALAALEQNRWLDREPAVAATGGSLVNRIRRLLYPERPNGSWTPLVASSVLILTGAAALAAWQTAPSPEAAAKLRAEAEATRKGVVYSATAVAARQAGLSPDALTKLKAEAEAQASVVTDAYSHWLNQDVVYIIGDDERAAFEKLASDAERDKFIEQFWLRRDPAPDTAENKFKTEHYRRIAYANDRFAPSSRRAGWQTDRGHLYIVYGPPDEIESHPAAGQKPYPYEVWMYRHVEGVGDNATFTFIDRTGHGDYRIAPGSTR